MWTQLGEVPDDAVNFASAYVYDDNIGVIVAGGSNGGGYFSSAHRTIDGVFFEELADMPSALCCGCMVALDDDTVFLAGGKSYYITRSLSSTD